MKVITGKQGKEPSAQLFVTKEEGRSECQRWELEPCGGEKYPRRPEDGCKMVSDVPPV